MITKQLSTLLKVYLLLSLTFLFLASSEALAEKKKVAIMEFENNTAYHGWRLGYSASDIFTTELVKTSKFSVMERDKLGAVLKEQDLGASGRIDPATAAKIGKVLGIDYMITGSVSEYGEAQAGGHGFGISLKKKSYRAVIDARVVDINTAEIVYADSKESSAAGVNVDVFGVGGGEDYNEQQATKVMRGAIEEFCKEITTKFGN